MFSKSKLIKQVFSSAPTEFAGHITLNFAGRDREIKLCRTNVVPNGSSKTLYTVADQVMMVADLLERSIGANTRERVMAKSRVALYGPGMENISMSLASAYKVASSESSHSNMPKSLPAQMRYTLGDTSRGQGNDALTALSQTGIQIAEHAGMEGLYTALNNSPYMMILGGYCKNPNNQIRFDSANPTGMASLGAMNVYFVGVECTHPHELLASSYMLARAMRPEPSLYDKLQCMSREDALSSEEKSVGRALLSSYEVVAVLQEQCNGRPYTSKLLPGAFVASISRAVDILRDVKNDAYNTALKEMMTTIGSAHLQAAQSASPSM